MRQLSIFLLLLVGFGPGAVAQLYTQYTFSASLGSFDTLGAGMVVPGFSTDDQSSAPIPLGFNFSFGGVVYSQVIANTNGWLSFGNINPQTWQTYVNTTPVALDAIGPCIFPLWTNLTGATGTASYMVSGIAPNRVFTFEWKNWGCNNYATAPVLGFQVRLYETTNVVELVYDREPQPIMFSGGFFGYCIGMATGSTDFWVLNNISTNTLSHTTNPNGQLPAITLKPDSGQHYIFTPLPLCSGMPAAAHITTASQNTCPGVPNVFSVAGFVPASGLTFQWQSRPAGTGSFVAVAGATGITYTMPGQTAARDYRCMVTCTPAGATLVSDTFTLGMYAPLLCYCSGNLGGSPYNGYSIDSVSIPNTTLLSPSPGFAPGFYTLYPPSGNTTATLEQGGNYILKVVRGGAALETGAWIDYNHNGIYSSNEYIPFSGAVTGPAAVSVNFSVPAAAGTGLTGMRIRVETQGIPLTAADGCTFLGSGESEDYLITIVPPGTCTGSPAGGTVSSNATLACPNTDFVLSLTGYTVLSTVTLQWQAAPSGSGVFADIAGATSSQFTVNGQSVPTDYRCRVLCTSNGSVSFSDTLVMNQAAIAVCYCIPTTMFGCNGMNNTHDINDFILEGIGSASISDLNTGCSPVSYEDRTAAFPPLELIQGETYYGYLASNGYGSDIRTWVDFGDDAVFNIADTVTPALHVPSNFLGYTLHIPLAADPGVHRLRMRMAWFQLPVEPCDLMQYGETHDYMVNILEALPADVGVTLITRPTDGALFCVGDTVKVRVVIGNQGSAPQTGFTIKAEYGGPATGSFQTVYNGILAPHTVDTVYVGYFAPQVAGNYSLLSLSVLNGDTRMINDTSFGSFIVYPIPVIDLGSDTSLCPSQLPYTLDAGNPGQVYQWNTGETTQTIGLNGAGVFTVKVTNQFVCSATDTMSLAVKPLPSVSGISIGGSGNEFSFGAGFPQNVDSYVWSFGDGTTSTDPAPAHEYSLSGNYPVRLVVVNECGSDTALFDLLVLYTNVTGPANRQADFALYPNPASEWIRLGFPVGTMVQQLMILNDKGEMVRKQVLDQIIKDYELDVRGLVQGHYILVLNTANGASSRMFSVIR